MDYTILHFGTFGAAFALFLFLAPETAFKIILKKWSTEQFSRIVKCLRSAWIAFQRIVKKRSTEHFSGIPFVMRMLNCLLSAWYGMPFVSANNLQLSTVNGKGTAIEFLYVTSLLIFAPKREKLKILGLLSLILAVFAVIVLVSDLFALHGNGRKLFCCIAASIFSIIMNGSPLKIILLMITTKSVEFMPFFSSLLAFLCGTSWFIFGLLGKDPFVAIPNGFACGLGAFELTLYAKYRSQYQNKDTSVRANELPTDLLQTIAQYLFGKDIVSFRLVCKKWNEVHEHHKHYPYLLQYASEKLSLLQFNSSVLVPAFHKPKPVQYQVLHSKGEWVFIRTPKYDYYFVNPFDKVIIDVDSHLPFKSCETFSFCHPPTSVDHLFLGMKNDPPYLLLHVVRGLSGDVMNYVGRALDCKLSHCSPIVVRGIVYFSNKRGDVGTVNINVPIGERVGRRNQYNKCLERSFGIKQLYLVYDEQGDEIFGVFIYQKSRKVRVYKLLRPQMKWEKVRNIGNKMFFVSRTSSFLTRASFSYLEKKVFFGCAYGEDSVYYSLETNKYHRFDGREIEHVQNVNSGSWMSLERPPR